MSLTIRDFPASTFRPTELDEWRSVPTAIASDEMARTGTADAGIKPLGEGRRLAGPAFTVRAMAADNLAIHHAVSIAPSGVVLVIDAGGYGRNAVWGGILHRAAEVRGVRGVVVDGCVRDAAELRVSDVPCFARGIVPAGPHKGFGGEVNGMVQIGGAVVAPGDLVIGDDDGVAFIPAGEARAIYRRCQDRLAAEARILERLAAGETTVEILGLGSPKT